jgi:hypothetical protein
MQNNIWQRALWEDVALSVAELYSICPCFWLSSVASPQEISLSGSHASAIAFKDRRKALVESELLAELKSPNQ